MWFVRLGGRETGPHSEDRLRTMLRLNQFSPLYQVSRDKVRWESAAPLIRQLHGGTGATGSSTIGTATLGSGADRPGSLSGTGVVNRVGEPLTTAEKWAAEAKIRQAQRAAGDATLRHHPPTTTGANHTGWNKPQISSASSPSASPPGVVSVQIQQAGKTVTDRTTGGARVLLHPVSLALNQGELTAVIGPSGSGKSTWLGLLTGRALPTTGRITVFGRDLNREFAIVKRSLSAVPQMDAFLTSLKVRTSLYYSACLRLPVNTSRIQLVERVEAVLGAVGLDECGDRRISQLSGGQLRRLSLAQELLSDPDVMYLDEVTSGLDEHSDAAIMALLRQLAASGRTIMIITHHLHNLQDNCHKLVVLAAGGYMVFYGSPQEACDSFRVRSVTEVLPIVKSMRQDEIADRCQNANAGSDLSLSATDVTQTASQSKSPRQARNLADFVTLVKRQLSVLISSPLSTLMSLFICAMIGVLLVISYPNMKVPQKPAEFKELKTATLARMSASKQKQYVEDGKKYKSEMEKYAGNLEKNALDSNSIVFILTVSSFFLGCLAGTRELVMERRLFWRESGTEMSVWSYLGSKLFVHALLTSVQASCLGTAVVYFTRAECSSLGVSIASIVAAISGLSTGFFISAASRSEAVATKLMLLAVLPQMILSGALNKKPEFVIKLLAQIFITSHYSFQFMCGLFPKDVRDNLVKPQYSMSIVIAIGVLHSAILLGGAVFFLKRTANGEDPSRGE
ncbi:MAG: transporter ATP-binding/permease protein [Planctomycetaceae bacterium]|nr:transporter ATP-binding/permease protein [Planctomycetaceae bacterium]